MPENPLEPIVILPVIPSIRELDPTASDSIIIYKNLRDCFLTRIKNMVSNLDNLENVPEAFKAGYTTNSKKINNGWLDIAIDNSSAVTMVTTATLESEFDAFMSARGINTKSNKLVTTKGMIQFWNYAATFCALKIVRVCSTLTTKTILVYKSNDQFPNGKPDYANPGLKSEADNNYAAINDTDVSKALSSLFISLNNTAKIKSIIYTYTPHCSCSSSSSSSSCSSSVFIGYMKLTS